MIDTRNNSKETFFVYLDGSVYSEHNYFSDAMKTALAVANIFPKSKVDVISNSEALAPKNVDIAA